MNYLIGVDLGTQGTKVVMHDEQGQVVAQSFCESRLIYGSKGEVTQDPEEMLQSVVKGIKLISDTVKDKVKSVVAIAIDGQMAGIMGIDKNGMAVTPYDSWLDIRCGNYRKPFLDIGEEEVIKLTGAPVTYAHGPKILWWKTEEPQIYNKIYKFIQPNAYCALRLCELNGDNAYIDRTFLHFSGFADTANARWSESLLKGLSVDKEKMPTIVNPTKIIGKISSSFSSLCGLSDNVTVVAGCGDTAASAFGAGAHKNGTLFDVAGTASVLGCITDSYFADVTDKTIIFAPSVLEGHYMPMAYINGGGMCLKWFRDDIMHGSVGYKQLDDIAQNIVAGSENLFFIPHFSGRVCPNDTKVRGGFINLSWTHESAHMYRAILEGIAYEYGIYADIIKKLIPSISFNKVISVGGGSRSALFRRIKSDVLGAPVVTINMSDTATLGCCAIAGYAVGLCESPTLLVEKAIKEQTIQQPNNELYRFYDTRKNIYSRCISSLHGVYEDIQKMGAN